MAAYQEDVELEKAQQDWDVPDAAIESLNAAAAAASSNSDIATISENVEDVQTSLAELLAQSSVFSSNISVSF